MAIDRMDTDPRNNQNDRSASDSSDKQGREDVGAENPQGGDSWNNYQTKELSSESESGISAEEAADVFTKEGDKE